MCGENAATAAALEVRGEGAVRVADEGIVDVEPLPVLPNGVILFPCDEFRFITLLKRALSAFAAPPTL